MSLPKHYLLAEEDESTLSLTTQRHIRSPRNTSNSIGKMAASSSTLTLDRRMQTNGKDMNSVYSTLPRQSKQHQPSAANYAKIKSLATFTNIYLNNKELGIAEEELRYLKAVESGDLDEVRAILNANDVLSSDSEDDEVKPTANNRPGENDVRAQNNNPTPIPLIVTSQTSEESAIVVEDDSAANVAKELDKKDSLEENSTCVKSGNSAVTPDNVVLEMHEVDEKRKPTKPSFKHIAHPSKWQVKHGQKSSPVTPLPVVMVTPEQSKTDRLKKRETLKKLVGLLPSKNELRFNKNCRDQWGRSALFIAMLHLNTEMMELLLEYKVEIDECLYHAIDFGYYDVVELFMKYDKKRNQVITGDDSFYPPGLTPIQLAAHKNDYVMLKILHSNGFKISNETAKKRIFSRKPNRTYNTLEKPMLKTVLERAWDATNNDILYYRARASPAYMVMMFTENPDDAHEHWDMLENLFSLYKKLKKKATDEPSAATLYRQLASQVEDFACDLLSEVRSPTDLTDLLRFDPPGHDQLSIHRHYLNPVERACEVRMKSFVAHENCQLALSTLRQGTLFECDNGWRPFIVRTILAFLFPIISLAFIIAPNSKPGRLLRNPMVNLSCHIASEISFLLLMIIRLILLTNAKCDCLGQKPGAVDYIVFVWVIAKGYRYFNRLRVSPTIQFMTNVWNMNDSGMIFLSLVIAVMTIVDTQVTKGLMRSRNLNVTCSANLKSYLPAPDGFDLCNRETWELEFAWPVYISEVCYALIYILIFVRAMELLYIDRTLGPLQLSLDKMMVDIFRFLVLFAVTFMAFAFGMTQLYWAYGTPRLFRMNVTEREVCGDTFDSSSFTCYPVYSSIIDSILEQYWTLYGYGYGAEPTAAVKVPGQSTITLPSGLILSMVFHMWAVVVMLNMLIAMMSHSFDRVRDNAEIEWKYHRSGMWMRYVKVNVCPRPCPMNLLPTVQSIVACCAYFKAKCLCRCGRYDPDSETPERRNARKQVSSDSVKENKRYRQAISRISTRYLRRYLLPDFKHDVGDPNRSAKKAYGHRGSIISSDTSSS
uniref:short transient receptor potential channel 5 n=1 Tax=Ciona intestinalis TaxID=7719 RepID=UPI000180CE35|nr:short transient receptor potential channel 5 [Ciona intestinalis]XP_018668520.1 short transient receptor potential channel 5 [Ciona intestinalis]XP_026691185.1 short transient receptor potential channel 5 [Ciona intestinalis]|eukprot:XP_009859269.1 short transient receptor potential channel 5 [Ciona intestinalis]